MYKFCRKSTQNERLQSLMNICLKCQAYSEGLIGGHLCPDLCTSKTLQLQNCLGEHKHFRSRVRNV